MSEIFSLFWDFTLFHFSGGLSFGFECIWSQFSCSSASQRSQFNFKAKRFYYQLLTHWTDLSPAQPNQWDFIGNNAQVNHSLVINLSSVASKVIISTSVPPPPAVHHLAGAWRWPSACLSGPFMDGRVYVLVSVGQLLRLAADQRPDTSGITCEQLPSCRQH